MLDDARTASSRITRVYLTDLFMIPPGIESMFDSNEAITSVRHVSALEHATAPFVKVVTIQ